MPNGGTIYAIAAEGIALTKIGSTRKNVTNRLQELQTGQPFKLAIVATAAIADNVRDVEAKVHRFLAEKRQRGEWFALESLDDEGLAQLIVEALAYVAPPKPPPSSTVPTLDMHAFGKRLRAARLQADVTQTALAHDCAINLPHLNALERGKGAGARAETVLKLAWRLDVSTDYLLGLEVAHG